MSDQSQHGAAQVDAKAKRYDRQLRIWGAHGQAALESAQVCLLGSGPTGTETLKNLVLGGIAGFTVVDDARVEARDYGNNFCIDPSQLGQSRAAAVTDNLKELNDSVEGSYVEEKPSALLASNPDFFQRFALVVATQMAEQDLVQLDRVCRRFGTALIAVRTYGLVGTLRVSIGEHCVIESKPDNILDDLRLAAPWPELQQLASSVDLDALDDVHHKHVPYVILLLQAVQHWQDTHEGTLPSGSAQQREFKDAVRSMQRRTPDGIPLEEENFAEAVANANKVWASTGIAPEVRRILDDPKARPEAVTRDTPEFWVLAAAMRRFVEQEGVGVLPLEGSLPDMTASTSMYLELGAAYRTRAESDAAAVEAHARKLLEASGREPEEIPSKSVRLFCRNARNLRVVRTRSLDEETSPETVHTDRLKGLLACEDTGPNAALYVLLRSADRFARKFNRYPGTYDSELEDDAATLKNSAVQLLSSCSCSSCPIPDDLAAEVVRCGAGELHTVAAIMAGMAAQEAIKVLTKQFVPLSGTLLYNGIASTTTVLDL